jgi:hypothetical protein
LGSIVNGIPFYTVVGAWKRDSIKCYITWSQIDFHVGIIFGSFMKCFFYNYIYLFLRKYIFKWHFAVKWYKVITYFCPAVRSIRFWNYWMSLH